MDGSEDDVIVDGSEDDVIVDGFEDVVTTTTAAEYGPKDDEDSIAAIVDENIWMDACSEVITNVDDCSEEVASEDVAMTTTVVERKGEAVSSPNVDID